MTGRLIAVANGRLVGEITRDAKGRLRFTYDAAWRADDTAYPLSLSMPLAAARHGHDTIEPWLWGLLPDNENVLARWARRFQVSAAECVFAAERHRRGLPGGGSVRPAGTCRCSAGLQTPHEVDWLTTADVDARLRTLRSDNSAWRLEEDVGQFSLAGAQAKTALLLENTRWGIPRGMTPTTHILKPPIPGFPGHCQNEHICLAVAGALGIPVARSRVCRFGEETAIVVERYDRLRVRDRLVRFHQEDLCQVLGRSPLNKYESEGGPGCRDIGGALRSYCNRPGEDLRTFVKAIALNRVLGGTDAHARNFSLLIGAGGNARLAPLYDLASALPYPGHYAPSLKLAMKVGGEARLGYIRIRHWERFAMEVGLPSEEVLGICRSVAAEVPDRLADVVAAVRSEGLDHPIVGRLQQTLPEQAEACLTSLRG